MRIASFVPVVLLSAVVAACGNEGVGDRVDITTHQSDPIVGGVFDDDVTHDNVVVLMAMSGGMCTGSLISQPGEKGVILTARHCVANVISDYVTCQNDVAGNINAADIYVARDANPLKYGYQGVQQFILGMGERLFSPEGASLCGTDIALIVMDRAVSGIEPLRVRTEKKTSVGEQFTAYGYGMTNPTNQNSAGRRYRREGVTVMALGPVMWMTLRENEFQGTISICQGDSGGPAVSESNAVMGVTSRGGDCNLDQNLWSSVEWHKELIDEAISYAGSHYQDENGNLRDGSEGPEDPTGDPDPGEDGNGDDPVGGVVNVCGNVTCGEGQTCVSQNGEHVCGITCADNSVCPGSAVCDGSLKVCVTGGDDSGSCAMVSHRGYKGSTKGGGGVAGLLLIGLGLASIFRRRLSS